MTKLGPRRRIKLALKAVNREISNNASRGYIAAGLPSTPEAIEKGTEG